MKEVTLDDKTIAQLKNCDEYLTLREESGRLIGYFVPIDPNVREGSWGSKSPVSDEELERRRREPGTTTLAEIWKKLGRK